MNSRRTLLWILLTVVGLVLTACSSQSVPAGQGQQYGEGSEWIAGMAAQAVVEATVSDIGAVPADAFRAGEDRVIVTLTHVDWQGVLNPEYPSPELRRGDSVEAILFTSASLVDELIPGSSYVFFLGYTYNVSGETTRTTWSVQLVLTSSGDLVKAYDTPATRDVLNAILYPWETTADVRTALIEFNAQQVAELRAYPSERGVSSRTSRVRDLARSLAGESTAMAEDPAAVWSKLSAEERYLPSDPTDVPRWMEATLGVKLVPYEVLVIGDTAALLTGIDSLSLLFPDAGIMGRHIVDHVTGITGIAGMGPAGWDARLVAWTTAEAGDLSAQPKLTLLAAPSIEKAIPTDEGVTMVIDLRAKPSPTIEVLTRAEFDQLILDLEPSLSKQETDPNDPDPQS